MKIDRIDLLMKRVVSLGSYSEANKMSLLDYFRSSKTSSASLAKERLQILVAYERSSDSQPSYLPELQKPFRLPHHPAKVGKRQFLLSSAVFHFTFNHVEY